ncbi:hypothetical protein [Saccharothrix coeruleofusca]|uniref:Uncharacterized protein n=1 Tax=Saccharothrix coeruleofusca TaxID=33919 RepID=A0A918AGQ9_9PSEU|nr:hypothetical protein [Saccharothrix coeruleofusca]GGP39521.1 hypothetical protein GCM10010185_08850 [Saccharothrix coeruleofusca]
MKLVDDVRDALLGPALESTRGIAITGFDADHTTGSILGRPRVRFTVADGPNAGSYLATAESLTPVGPDGGNDAAALSGWYAGLIRTHVCELAATSALPSTRGASVIWEPWAILREH